MKLIKHGKKYDTDTARKLGTWSNNLSYRDFGYCEETLYRKKTGEYFLHGEGGPMSKYRTACGSNNWSGGEAITPLTYDDARVWAEEHLEADEYEEIFGEVADDDSRTTLSLSVSSAAAETAR